VFPGARSDQLFSTADTSSKMKTENVAIGFWQHEGLCKEQLC
jgi:hypothetical protein